MNVLLRCSYKEFGRLIRDAEFSPSISVKVVSFVSVITPGVIDIVAHGLIIWFRIAYRVCLCC